MSSPALQYQQLDIASLVDTASPHQLVEMLFDGACKRLRRAALCAERDQHEMRSGQLNEAVSIIEGLKASLDLEQGGDLAENLDALYDYMQRRLLAANTANDQGAILEVLDLMETVQEGWQAIGQDQ